MTDSHNRDCLPRQPGLHVMWAIPRSRSTAFLRMMIERGDFLCLHEPFCTLRDTGSVMLQDVNGEPRRLTGLMAAIDHILALARVKCVFLKETTDHDYADTFGSGLFASDVKTTLLVREPVATIASHLRKAPDADITQLGYRTLVKIGEHLEQRRTPFLVIDSDQLVADPSRSIRAFCEFSGIPFDGNSLNWAPGHRKEWQRAQHWHDEVAATSGFLQQQAAYPPFDTLLENKRKKLSEIAQSDYQRILKWRSQRKGWTIWERPYRLSYW